MQAAAGQEDAARGNFQTATRHLRLLVDRFPENPEYQDYLAGLEADLRGLDRSPDPP